MYSGCVFRQSFLLLLLFLLWYVDDDGSPWWCHCPLHVATMQTLKVRGWWASKFNRLFALIRMNGIAWVKERQPRSNRNATNNTIIRQEIRELVKDEQSLMVNKQKEMWSSSLTLRGRTPISQLVASTATRQYNHSNVSNSGHSHRNQRRPAVH